MPTTAGQPRPRGTPFNFRAARSPTPPARTATQQPITPSPSGQSSPALPGSGPAGTGLPAPQPVMPPAPTFWKVIEIAAYLRISKMSVYRLIHSGELPAQRIGRTFRVLDATFAAYLTTTALSPPASQP
jgi:excisionase family DNA binding protein